MDRSKRKTANLLKRWEKKGGRVSEVDARTTIDLCNRGVLPKKMASQAIQRLRDFEIARSF